MHHQLSLSQTLRLSVTPAPIRNTGCVCHELHGTGFLESNTSDSRRDCVKLELGPRQRKNLADHASGAAATTQNIQRVRQQ